MGKNNIASLQKHAANIRYNVVRMLSAAGSGHAAGSLDIVDILTCLYGLYLNYDKSNPDSDTRDMFVLSNGHTCPALYATLAEFGLIKLSELLTLRKFGSRLQGHPERTRLPWLETTSGPLGEGLSQAVGMAYALKYLIPRNHRLVYCLMGDGECDEGEIWEAAMLAGKYGLDNLIGIVDYNSIQLSGRTSDIMTLQPFGAKWADSSWAVRTIDDGNDAQQICDIFDEALADRSGRPRLIIARTTPGKGVSFMENDYHWHGKAPMGREAVLALAELQRRREELCQ